MGTKPTIQISDDRLQAFMELPKGLALVPDQLKQLVQDAGVCFGLDPAALKQATEIADLPRRLVIAKGQAVQEPTPGVCDWDEGVQEEDVPAGTELGVWEPPQEGVNGMGVDGAVLAARSIDSSEPPIDSTIRLAGDRLIANQEGKVRQLSDGRWSLVDEAGKLLTPVVLHIAGNGLSVGLELPVRHFVDANDLRKAFGERGITVGLVAENIAAATQPVAHSRCLLLAYGSAPRDGRDAELKFLIRRPEVDKSSLADIDFRNYSRFREVDVDAPLAEIEPATAGTMGRSVVNKELAARDGRDLELERFVGQGTTIAGNQIVAACEGIVRQAPDGVVEVREELVVEGDVNMTTGHIVTSKPVRIMGDVCSGFKIDCASDVFVQGLIEDCEVKVGGDLVIEGGVLPGRQAIEVQGQLMAKFIRDRHIRCGSLVIKQDLRLCTIEAVESVHAGSIVGGRLRAGGTVYCQTIGNEKEERTRVHLAIDADLYDEVEDRERAHAATEQSGKLGEDAKKMLEKEREADEERVETKVLMKNLQKTVRQLQKEAWLEVDEVAWPGVEMRIGLYYRMQTRRRYGATLFRLVEGDLVSLPLGGETKEAG